MRRMTSSSSGSAVDLGRDEVADQVVARVAPTLLHRLAHVGHDLGRGPSPGLGVLATHLDEVDHPPPEPVAVGGIDPEDRGDGPDRDVLGVVDGGVTPAPGRHRGGQLLAMGPDGRFPGRRRPGGEERQQGPPEGLVVGRVAVDRRHLLSRRRTTGRDPVVHVGEGPPCRWRWWPGRRSAAGATGPRCTARCGPSGSGCGARARSGTGRRPTPDRRSPNRSPSRRPAPSRSGPLSWSAMSTPGAGPRSGPVGQSPRASRAGATVEWATGGRRRSPQRRAGARDRCRDRRPGSPGSDRSLPGCWRTPRPPPGRPRRRRRSRGPRAR